MSQIGMTFQQLFEPLRGDLVYGKGDQRESYSERLVGEKKGVLEDCYWMIDFYNDRVGVSTTSFDYRSTNKPTQIGRLREDLEDSPDPTGRAGRYLDLLAGSRFTPAAIANMPQEKLMAAAAPKPTMVSRERFAMYHKSTRMACKFGIEYVVMHSPPQRLVHFILDGLGNELIYLAADQSVQKKMGYVQHGYQLRHKPITTSELLSVYRNWDVYRGRVLFYMDFKCVHPPWEEEIGGCPERETWSAYAADRHNRYDRMLSMQMKTGHARQFGLQIDELRAQADELIREGQYNQAASCLKAAYHLAKDGRLPQGLSLYLPGAHIPPTPSGPVGESGKPLTVHVQNAIAAYEGRKLGIRVLQVRSSETKDALEHLKSLLAKNQHDPLHAAVRHYIGLSDGPAPSGLTAPLKTDSSLYAALTLEFGRWLFGDHYNRQFPLKSDD